jgi:endonuclease/exonuclease/phosphatase family metal-dependent hydrolase
MIVTKLIPETNKQITIINIYFDYVGIKGKKTLNDLILIFLKILSKLKSLNLIITGDFNCNLDSNEK